MNISDINFGKRFRKDLGDIDGLVNSIKSNGLLCPIIVTADNLLIDGARRIKAYEKLGNHEIPFHIVNVPIKENGEIDANLVRKDFTVEEILAIKKYRESIEPNLQGKRTDRIDIPSSSQQFPDQLLGNFPQSSKMNRRERIAKDTGLSYKSLSRLEEVADMEKRYPELGQLTKKIDDGRMKVNQAWKIINAHKRRQQFLTQAKEVNGKNLPSGLNLIHGDCRHIMEKIDDNSIDLVFTDPPYAHESLHLYTDLGRIAGRLLRPGGSLIFYAPHHSLLEVGSSMMQFGLRQIWTMCVKHTGHLARIHSLNLRVNWKPLLWLVKGASQPNIIPDANFNDFINSVPPDKTLHDWAQSLTEAEYVIKNLTVEGQVVLDCFMGAGTTAIAALNNKRQFIGIEIDQEIFERAKANILSHNTSTPIPNVGTIAKKLIGS